MRSAAPRPGRSIRNVRITPAILDNADEEDVDGYAMGFVEDCGYRRIMSLSRIFLANIDVKSTSNVDAVI